MKRSIKRWVYGFFMAWGMFLAIPCPFKKWDNEARENMLALFPVVGALVGGLWALSAWLLIRFCCPKPVSSFLLAAFPWLVTGFIHLDGFMDVTDAVLSRRDLPERRRILKDPHCGAFGVIGLVLAALALFGLFLSAELEALSLVSLALIPVAVRSAAGLAVLSLRPMETSQYNSLGQSASIVKRGLLALVMLASAAVPAAVFGISGAGAAPLASIAAFWLFCLYAARNLGGMNGDVSGYALTLGELVGTAALVLIR